MPLELSGRRDREKVGPVPHRGGLRVVSAAGLVPVAQRVEPKGPGKALAVEGALGLRVVARLHLQFEERVA